MNLFVPSSKCVCPDGLRCVRPHKYRKPRFCVNDLGLEYLNSGVVDPIKASTSAYWVLIALLIIIVILLGYIFKDNIKAFYYRHFRPRDDSLI